jgi:hypothetical protein
MTTLKPQYLVAIGLAIAILMFSIGRFSAPVKTETKIVEHTVYKENQSIDRDQDVVVSTKKTKTPDGTVITETRKEKQTDTKTITQVDIDSQKSILKITEDRPSYRVGAVYEPPIPAFQDAEYQLIVEKRIVSEFYLGVSGTSRHTLGLSVSLGF